jgi:hypothetical protein
MHEKIPKIVIFSVIALLFLSIVLMILYFSLFPLAPHFDMPSWGSAKEVIISRNGMETKLSPEAKAMFTTIFWEMEPTRIPSDNDAPTGTDNYYYVHFISDEEDIRFYIYQMRDRYYMEFPYIGIYETNEYAYETVSQFFIVS